MIISIHQPNHLPYLGFFDKIARSDKFVIYDDAQFVKGDFHNRNKIRTKDGFQWLTVPVNVRLGQAINETKIDNKIFWAKKYFNSIIASYGSSPYFKDYIREFEEIYSRKWEALAELNISLIKFILGLFGINTPVMLSTEISASKLKSTEKLVDICRIMGATTYLSGKLGRDYMDETLFKNAGIKVERQNFVHPIYKQNFDGFVPNMSAIDLLFNHGETSLAILMNKKN